VDAHDVRGVTAESPMNPCPCELLCDRGYPGESGCAGRGRSLYSSMKHENKGERYSCCSAALQLAHSRVYSKVWECVRMIRCDSFSELPGIHLGKSWR